MEGYEIHESVRAKRLGLSVHPDGRVVLTKPVRVSLKAAEKFVAAHEIWILAAQETFRRKAAKRTGPPPIALPRPRKGSKAYKDARAAARTIVAERLLHFNALYGFKYGTLSIRDQKTRWGSCSAAGNLSFNYRIVFLPPALQDYVIVHELCHVKEHNHSARFWAQVARTLPDHVVIRRDLRAGYL